MVGLMNYRQKWSLLEPNKFPPQLEGLINTCKVKYKNKTDIGLLSDFRTTISRYYCNNYLKSQSMIEMWLLFYARIFYKKLWVEDKKQWVVSNKEKC